MTLPNAPRVGWIGTGRMGFALAERLLRAGYQVAAYNRTRAKAEPLAELGGTVVDSVGALADRDVVFSTVSGSAEFAAITIEDGGVLRQPATPSILIDCSTVDAEVSANVRVEATKVGTELLAAPVSGNPKVVRTGRASLVVSGPESAYRETAGLLAALGRSVTYAGEGETARLVKLCHNVFLGVVTQSLAEITVLAEKGGVRRAAFLEFLNSSVLGSTFTRYKSPALVHLDFTPTFTTSLLRKDFDLGLAAARALETPLPVASATYQLVQAAIGAGHGEVDFAALLLEQARAAGLPIEAEQTPVDDGLHS